MATAMEQHQRQLDNATNMGNNFSTKNSKLMSIIDAVQEGPGTTKNSMLQGKKKTIEGGFF